MSNHRGCPVVIDTPYMKDISYFVNVRTNDMIMQVALWSKCFESAHMMHVRNLSAASCAGLGSFGVTSNDMI